MLSYLTLTEGHIATWWCERCGALGLRRYSGKVSSDEWLTPSDATKAKRPR